MAPHARNLGASATLVGIVVAAYSITNLFGNLGAGFVLDRWGRRGPIIIGLAITALAVLSYAFVQSPEQLLVARAIHGIGAAALTPGAFSIIGDWVASDQRGRAMGLAGAMIAIPAMIGPPAAGLLRDAWGADSVFFLDAVVLAITLIAFAAVTRQLPYKAARRAAESAAAEDSTTNGGLMFSANATLFAVTVGVGVLVAHLPLVLESQGSPRLAPVSVSPSLRWWPSSSWPVQLVGPATDLVVSSRCSEAWLVSLRVWPCLALPKATV